MEKKTVRTGIVGAGFAARFHYEALKKIYGVNVEIEGVFDVSQEAAENYGKERGIKVYKSLEELIDKVDVVHVCTPPVTHEPVAVAALKQGKFAIVEKPMTGYFGDGSENFDAKKISMETVLEGALASIERMLKAEKESKGRILYAENWVYAPAIQKEREIIEKSGAQILRMYGEESHSGSHAPTYGLWKFSGGGTLVGKACHPLTAALYLKQVEGIARDGKPIRPKAVSGRVHKLTQLPSYQDKGHIRTDYFDVEDLGLMHVIFEDGMVADIVASEIVLGGIHNWIEIIANNHRTMCNINPNTAMQSYTPAEKYYKDIYIVEKTETKAGWSNPSPEEDFFTGYPLEMESFYRAVALGEEPQGNSLLGADTISAIYSAYVSAERGGAEVEIKIF